MVTPENPASISRDLVFRWRERAGGRLAEWARAARACDLPNLHAFTHGLDLHTGAAIAAVTLPCHNGRTEGVNTKTKLKRQMYGRAGFTLLGHRILLN